MCVISDTGNMLQHKTIDVWVYAALSKLLQGSRVNRSPLSFVANLPYTSQTSVAFQGCVQCNIKYIALAASLKNAHAIQ